MVTSTATKRKALKRIDRTIDGLQRKISDCHHGHHTFVDGCPECEKRRTETRKLGRVQVEAANLSAEILQAELKRHVAYLGAALEDQA